MAPTGFSPSDTVLAVSGAVWGAQLHALFWRWGVYAAAILVGAAAAAWRAAQTGRPHPLLAYALFSAGAFVALGTSPRPLVPSPPLSVQQGAAEEPSAPKPAPTDGAALPAGFLLVNRAMEDAARAFIAVVKRDFAERPFATVLALNALAGDRMDDAPSLQASVRDFVRTCYAEALALWRARRKEAAPSLAEADLARELAQFDTPAHATLVALYAEPVLNAGTRACAREWDAIRTELAARASGSWFGAALAHLAAAFPGLPLDRVRDLAAQRALRNLMADYAMPGESAQPIQVRWWDPGSWVAWAASYGMTKLAALFFHFILDQFVRFVAASIYPLYGMLQMLVYAAFPVVLALAMLPGQLGRLGAYLLTLLSIKLWPAFWAAVDAAHDRLLPSVVAVDRAAMDYPAMFEAVTMMAVAMVPSLATAIVGARLFSGLHVPTPAAPITHPAAAAGTAAAVGRLLGR